MVLATEDYWSEKVKALETALELAQQRVTDSELELVLVKQKARLRESELEMALDLAQAKLMAKE